ncbi:hypothetical protein RhiirA5_436257, partial [Rhizophagus irregularis]
AVDASEDAVRSGSGDKNSTDFPLSAELEGECWESSREVPEAGAEGTRSEETRVRFAELSVEGCKVGPGVEAEEP